MMPSPLKDEKCLVRSILAEDLLIGAREIGEYLGMSQSAAHRLLMSGAIPGGRVGALWVGSRKALDRHFAELTSGRKA
jgi:hypothetical protein